MAFAPHRRATASIVKINARKIFSMDIVISNQDLEANPQILEKLTLVRGDITTQSVDAILAPVPHKFKLRSMLDVAVREAAGQGYVAEVDAVTAELKPGACVVVNGHNLPAGKVLACVTPKWDGGFMGEDRALTSGYDAALKAAAAHGMRRIAVPIFLTGNHGYPKPRAVQLAVKAIVNSADPNAFDEIRFVAFKDDIYDLFLDRLQRYGWQGPLAI